MWYNILTVYGRNDMGKHNDLDPKKWKEYNDVLTDSLWIIDKRDNSGAHTGKYHGNFVPQIPHQLMTRYTKKGDWVLDTFMGSGTTLIEAQRMGRNSVGIELQKDVADEADERIHTEPDNGVKAIVKVGDSRYIDYNQIMKDENIDKFNFVIYHPPYSDIIKFSDDENDLSNTKDLNDFKEQMRKVITNADSVLADDGYCAIVISDMYKNGAVIPLGFECMNLFIEKGYVMKGIIVKNFGDTKGKSNQAALWRYRAIANDFYIFKHEYVFVFKKNK